MAEDKNKKNEEQLKDEQLDQVAGGFNPRDGRNPFA